MAKDRKIEISPLNSLHTPVTEQMIGPYLSNSDLANFAHANKKFGVLSRNILKNRAFEKVVKSGNAKEIITLLRNGYLPRNLNIVITLDSGKSWEKQESLVEIVISEGYFGLADRLLEHGAKMPESFKKRLNDAKYASKSEYFSALVTDYRLLYYILRTQPAVITEKDEDGLTLLHHVIIAVDKVLSSLDTYYGLCLLCNAPGINFSTPDNNGNTPAHLAAIYCENRVVSESVFPHIIKGSAEHKFDFSTLNEQGQSVLHIATRKCYINRIFGRKSNIQHLIDIPGVDVNVLSSSGSTALYYAIDHQHLEEARLLLDRGADPMLGADDRKPLKMIDEHLQTYAEILANPEAYDFSEQELGEIPEKISELQQLKERMLELSQKPAEDSKQSATSQPESSVCAASSVSLPSGRYNPMLLNGTSSASSSSSAVLSSVSASVASADSVKPEEDSGAKP